MAAFLKPKKASTNYSTSSPFDVSRNPTMSRDEDPITPPHASMEKQNEQPGNTHHFTHHIPFINPHPKTKFVKHEGESGRSGFHPLKFVAICFRSSCTLSMLVNILWPLVPAAIAVHFALNTEEHDNAVTIFTINYLALIPAANLIGFAGQELARKLPKVLGVLLENTVGAITELIIFIVLTVYASKDPPYVESGFVVVKAAILGSILANLLLALGLCFIAGGIRHSEQTFHAVITEVGSGLLLVAGVALVTPAAFSTVLENSAPNAQGYLNNLGYEATILSISRGTSVMLLIAFATYLIFQMTSHHSIYDDVLEADEQKDRDRHQDLTKEKLTLTECIVALLIGVACVALTAVFLVLEIDTIINDPNTNVSEAFMGLILVPLVEKVAEHLTAMDEAWDNQANFALIHVLGSTIQTALFNAPIAVFVSWGLRNEQHPNAQLDLDFRTFECIMIILAILLVGNFLRDGKSNYLEGVLCVLVYVIIALCAFYYPDTEVENAGGEGTGETTATAAAEALVATATAVARMLKG